MQAAVEAARAAQEQQRAVTRAEARARAAAAPAKSQPKQLWPPVQQVPPDQQAPPQATGRPQPDPVATPRPVTNPPPDRAGQAIWTGQGGSVRQPSPSGSAFIPAAVPAPPRPSEPSSHRRRSGPRVAGAAALAVILLAAGTVAFALSARDGGSKTPTSGQPRPTQQARPSLAVLTANLAARWVDLQVNHGVIVACDKAMCDALTAHGFPGRHLKLIRPGGPYPSHAEIIVETPLVARQFGDSFNVAQAPPVLTRIGTGDTAIAIRVVARQGEARYKAQIKADLRQRRLHGAALLTSRQVTASALARKQLIAGEVDIRLIVVLTAIASVHPIDILGFGAAFPGASPAVALRTADLAQSDGAAGLSRSAYIKFLLTLLDAEPSVYRPQTAVSAHLRAGTPVFQITFSAPSPLKLLAG